MYENGLSIFAELKAKMEREERKEKKEKEEFKKKVCSCIASHVSMCIARLHCRMPEYAGATNMQIRTS